MSLTQAQISHLAKLTALAGKTVNIESVIDSFDTLAKIDTQGIDGGSRSGKGSLLPRPDMVHGDETMPDKLLSCSKQRKAAHQIVLSGIMHSE